MNDAAKTTLCKPYLYIDNCAWADLVLERRKGTFQFTTEHVATIKSSYLTVLSDLNYAEASGMLISPKRSTQQDGRTLLHHMLDLAESRLFLGEDLLEMDIRCATQRKRETDYFVGKDLLRKLREDVWCHGCNSEHLKVQQRLRKWKEFLWQQLAAVKKKCIDRGMKSDYADLLKGLQCPSPTNKIVEFLLFINGVNNFKYKAIKLMRNLRHSKVAILFLKFVSALGYQYISERQCVDPNDTPDGLHYAMSGFCDYFVTSDKNLLRILGNIPDSHVKVASLLDFVSGGILEQRPVD